MDPGRYALRAERRLTHVAKQAKLLRKEEYKDIRVKDIQLHLAGRAYHLSELESLPVDLRPSTICTKRSDETIVFFGRYSPLSNHHCSPFSSASYNSVEHFLAVERAKLSSNQELIDMTCDHTNPADSKGILNALKDDHNQEWAEALSNLILDMLHCKFTQNKLLGTYLRVTNAL